MVITIGKTARHRRIMVLAILGVALLHLSLMPAALPDCHGDSDHSSHSHAFCHCTCCQHGETSAADSLSFVGARYGLIAPAPDPLHGRDVVFLLFRPPQQQS